MVRREWGSVARKGARVVREPAEGRDRPRPLEDRSGPPENREQWQPDVWVRDPEPEPARRTRPSAKRAAAGTERARNGTGTPPDAPAAPLVQSPARQASSAKAKAERRLAEATRAYEADRYPDARRLLRPLVFVDDPLPAARELYGLTLYRMGRWADAIKELEAFAAASGSYDQHPVLADCHRALGHWAAVEGLWEEIRQASPGPDVVAEGRIVAAGALADQGRLGAALQVLERTPSNVKRPGLHHLRLWYARADLYERAGEVSRAREAFRAILRHDPDFVDTAERLATLE